MIKFLDLHKINERFRTQIDTRIKEAKKLGMKKILVPYANYMKCTDKDGIFGVKSIYGKDTAWRCLCRFYCFFELKAFQI